ncbi:MAG: site-2 protease family protein, partial [Saprospiraceae bacterium]|nr:site-2 protease family protein [Saprospiraceae bacterium]
MIEQAFRIGSFANIPVRIHWSFFLLIFYIIGSGLYDKMDWPSIILLVAFTLCLFICVVLHEFGHALTAKKFGVKTADIILLPIGGVARLMNLPQKPSHELWIAIMGPVVNLIIAAIIFVGLFITYGAEMIHLFVVELSPRLSVGEFFAMLLQANILLMVFNLVPAFPMDGGRVLRALLAMKTSRLSATLWASRIGQLASIGFVIVGFYFEAWTLMLIGVFIFFGASQEYQFVKRDTKYKDKFIKDYYRRLINH